MQRVESVTLRQLFDVKYASVLCYPKYDAAEAAKRLGQLKELGVRAIDFTGDKRAFTQPVLGKGYVGVVVVAETENGLAALKIRRLDAGKERIEHEAEMLAKANQIGIGPRLIDKREDFLLMELIKGSQLPQWVMNIEGKNAKNRIRGILLDVLEQCYRLDRAGLDHGELSHAPKHIIINGQNKPHIVDFETASIHRRPSNVTSVCQYLFMKSQVAKILRGKLGKVHAEALIASLRRYKQEPNRQNFNRILETCKLT